MITPASSPRLTELTIAASFVEPMYRFYTFPRNFQLYSHDPIAVDKIPKLVALTHKLLLQLLTSCQLSLRNNTTRCRWGPLRIPQNLPRPACGFDKPPIFDRFIHLSHVLDWKERAAHDSHRAIHQFFDLRSCLMIHSKALQCLQAWSELFYINF